jgi:Na+-transporting methylmalonyl-CoA/oxaloacetate decarboxylase gamma subunit
MENMGLGLIITLVGISVTLITLILLMFVIALLSRIFPYKEEIVPDHKKNHSEAKT